MQNRSTHFYLKSIKKGGYACIPLLLFTVILHFSAASQEYQSMLNPSANWNFAHTTSCLPFTPEAYQYSVYLNGDTLINGTNYQKAIRPYREWFLGDGSECNEELLLQTGYIGALREDASERKVYFVPPGQDDEVLLYDFTMEAGATLNGYLYQNWGGEPLVVDSVDQIMINGEIHRRLIIDAETELFLIEGIGSTFGLVDGDPFGMLDSPATILLCWTNEGAYYPETAQSCAIITSTGDFSSESSIINIFPNPTHDSFNVLLSEKYAGKSISIELLNINGQPILSQRSIYSSNSITIEMGNLPSGNYVVRVNADGHPVQHQYILKL